MEKKMNNFNISSSFNINNTIYFIDYHKMLILGLTTPKISTAKIIGIYITSDNIRYDYQGKTNSGSFYEKDINKKFFSSYKAAENSYSPIVENIDYFSLYLLIRKHLIKFPEFTRFNSSIRNIITHRLSYSISKKIDDLDLPDRKKSCIADMINQISPNDISKVLKDNGIKYCSFTAVKNSSSFLRIESTPFNNKDYCTIKVWKTNDEQDGETAVKIYKNGTLVFIINCSDDPKINKEIDNILSNII